MPDALRLAQYSTVAKLVGNFGQAAEMLLANPNLILIGRQISVYPASDGRVITAENMRHLSPVLAANQWVDFQRDTYRLNSLIKYWEGPNEPSWEVQNPDGSVNIPATIANYEWYGEFEAERVWQLAQIGLRAVVGNFSYGTPDIGPDKLYAWEPMLPALRAAKQCGGLLGLHEYEFDLPLSWGRGWLTFRYRKVHDWFLAPNGLGDLPIVLTEFGADFKIRSWDYVDELIWAEREMRRDPYLLGACIFTYGSTDPTWLNYDMAGTPEAAILNEYAATLPPIDNTPPDEPDDEPDTGDDDMTTNLLVNPTLFVGTHTLPGHDNMRVGDGWDFTWKDGTIELENQVAPFLQPETKFVGRNTTPTSEALPPEEWPLYLADDAPVVWQAFKGWGPQWWKLSQQLDLAAGRYLLSAQLYPDIYFSREGAREWASDPLSGEWRLVGQHAVLAPVDLPWLNGATTLPLGVPPRHQFGRWVQLTHEWDHPGGLARVGLEFRARFGVDVVGAFVRRFSLVQVNVTTPPIDPIGGSIATDLLTARAAIDSALLKLQSAQMSAQNTVDLIGS